jgi:hypothetical protein
LQFQLNEYLIIALQLFKTSLKRSTQFLQKSP